MSKSTQKQSKARGKFALMIKTWQALRPGAGRFPKRGTKDYCAVMKAVNGRLRCKGTKTLNLKGACRKRTRSRCAL